MDSDATPPSSFRSPSTDRRRIFLRHIEAANDRVWRERLAQGFKSIQPARQNRQPPVAVQLVRERFTGAGHNNRDLNGALDVETVTVNVLAFMKMAQGAVRHFLRRGRGHLVGISSVAALRGNGAGAAYAASKAFQACRLRPRQPNRSCAPCEDGRSMSPLRGGMRSSRSSSSACRARVERRMSRRQEPVQ